MWFWKLDLAYAHNNVQRSKTSNDLCTFDDNRRYFTISSHHKLFKVFNRLAEVQIMGHIRTFWVSIFYARKAKERPLGVSTLFCEIFILKSPEHIMNFAHFQLLVGRRLETFPSVPTYFVQFIERSKQFCQCIQYYYFYFYFPPIFHMGKENISIKRVFFYKICQELLFT